MIKVRWLLAWLALVGTELRAQAVLLELRPHEGDTLRMRLDQTTEMVGTRGGSTPMKVTTALQMFSRAIVEGRTATATLIFAVTDSVELSSSDANSRKMLDRTEAQLVGRKMRLRLSPNGVVALVDRPSDLPKTVTEMVSIMPASFPAEPVAVGQTWVREMPVPPSARFGIPIGGMVRSTFRFDSLSKGGNYAYVSMRGTLVPDRVSVAEEASIGGSVDGSMVVDRRRGWLAESRFMIRMRTSVPAASGVLGAPLSFRTTITQRMRVLGPATLSGQR
jgi:hypothetical protein